MSRHYVIGFLLFIASTLIMLIYLVAALAPCIIASPLGIAVERLQFTLIFIPIVVAMMDVSAGIAYVGYSIVVESREGRGKKLREERGDE